MLKVHIPPIKSQGIKTKLIPWIQASLPHAHKGRWIEPFMGTGVVGFNLASSEALMCDTNPHLIRFYQSLLEEKINPQMIKLYLQKEGAILSQKGEEHYYFIRERFNKDFNPLDFLFLNRAGFNGMIRFNRKGGFNIPFCKKPERFAQAYVTKIVNQTIFLSTLFKAKKFEFKCQSYKETLKNISADDLVYCDPPYIDRHVDYYNSWGEIDERNLFKLLLTSNAKFILSTWHHNQYRTNTYIDLLWNQFHIQTQDHFYHIGAKEINRNSMTEALICNFETLKPHLKNLSSLLDFSNLQSQEIHILNY
ncbi:MULTISPECIES: Dam family site-specific DNA-(adenine-N6)-methyltransferase [unclassified Sulfurospirillum]|uniref:DNA adenine methylase n=1 Tax=unclassified Sulfurospirillum TaxID=2618290 RepID=UPI00050860A7|nr:MULTISPECIES: Dam family site-specific DNA-(adenine-N6)-methyltransferase [unclassified Sulfurospirillum]KFL33793.1 DNA adenine methylase [Sulfurospirillum sp. SCADC]